MKDKKKRKAIPKELSAKVLFYTDRTCCVCRKPQKPVQIHHIDENPSNNDISNLAVLCLDCHNDTMLKGGFGRKLDSDQIILYRDDWINKIVESRTRKKFQTEKRVFTNDDYTSYLASITEIYRENKQFDLLAIQYSIIENNNLRDKYIELAIKNNPNDSTIIFLRGLQNKIELVPLDVKEKEYKRLTDNEDWTQRARFHINFNNFFDATKDYIIGINKSLENGQYFTAAFYLKELYSENLVDSLFELALKKAADEEDLWWQLRSLEELGWFSQIEELLLNNAEEIENSNNKMLLSKLEKARGNFKNSYKIYEEMAKKSVKD